MISDNELYSLAIFLGSFSMLLIVLYHFLEVNAKDNKSTPSPPAPPFEIDSSSTGRKSSKAEIK